jgi:hypothetical protein
MHQIILSINAENRKMDANLQKVIQLSSVLNQRLDLIINSLEATEKELNQCEEKEQEIDNRYKRWDEFEQYILREYKEYEKIFRDDRSVFNLMQKENHKKRLDETITEMRKEFGNTKEEYKHKVNKQMDASKINIQTLQKKRTKLEKEINELIHIITDYNNQFPENIYSKHDLDDPILLRKYGKGYINTVSTYEIIKMNIITEYLQKVSNIIEKINASHNLSKIQTFITVFNIVFNPIRKLDTQYFKTTILNESDDDLNNENVNINDSKADKNENDVDNDIDIDNTNYDTESSEDSEDIKVKNLNKMPYFNDVQLQKSILLYLVHSSVRNKIIPVEECDVTPAEFRAYYPQLKNIQKVLI